MHGTESPLTAVVAQRFISSNKAGEAVMASVMHLQN
jgi:hypothetical protein